MKVNTVATKPACWEKIHDIDQSDDVLVDEHDDQNRRFSAVGVK